MGVTDTATGQATVTVQIIRKYDNLLQRRVIHITIYHEY